MKIEELRKRFWFIISLVLIGIACLLMFLNKLSYNNYLEMKEEYVEVDCIVIRVDDIKRTITVAYVYDGVELYEDLQTIEYGLGDSFVAVVKASDPDKKIRFDNGYSMWNTYTYLALTLTIIAILLDLLILKRIIIRFICMTNDKTSLNVIDVKGWRRFHYLIVEYNGKIYKSELFTTYENIHLVEENVYVDFYKKGVFHYIDLSTYKKAY